MSGGTGEVCAWIDGAPVAWEAAVTEAARVIGASAQPAFAHLGADVDGAREAVLLAECAGGVLDHAFSAALIADLDPLRESGGMQTTPLEAAVRADLVLILGAAAPDWLARSRAQVIRADAAMTGEGADRLAFLATLRARVLKRPVAAGAPKLDDLAESLRAAKFGVVVWDAMELEPLAIEALHGLVRDLNETTRFSTLAVAAPEHGPGVQQVCGWMTGFPLRTGFARGMPEHDPWRYDARRLAAAGETDCVIWVSSFAGGAPAPSGAAVVLGPEGDARVRFAVAEPGAIQFESEVGAFVARQVAASALPTVAATLAAIRAAIRAALEAAPC